MRGMAEFARHPDAEFRRWPRPLTELRTAVAARELESAHDPAAVLTWRIHTPQNVGPLPWLPPIPANLTEHPSWGPYLIARAKLVEAFDANMREETGRLGRPGWALPGQQLTPELIEDVELWRAATGVESADRRVLGPTQLGAAARSWQLHLEKRLQPETPATWVDMLAHLHPAIHDDPYAVFLNHRMAALHAAGVPVSSMVAAASPRLCSIPISAAFSTCSGVPPSTAAIPAAAIERAEPISGSPPRPLRWRRFLDDETDGRGCEEKLSHTRCAGSLHDANVVVPDSGDDAHGSVGGQ